MSGHYADYSELEAYTHKTGNGSVLVDYRNLAEYPGMVLYFAIHFNIKKEFQLILEYISLGLDLYGDTLQESYLYKFESLSALLQYLENRYGIRVTDIPKKYTFDSSRFPDPLKNAAEKPEFELAWERFQQDFRKGIFLDPKLELVYSSLNQ